MSTAIVNEVEVTQTEAAREAEVMRITIRLTDAITREVTAIVGADSTKDFATSYPDDSPIVAADDELGVLRDRYLRGEVSKSDLIAGCTKLLEAWKEAARTFVQQQQEPKKTRTPRCR